MSSFAGYLKDVKNRIKETDVEAVRSLVAARKGKAGDGNGAGPVLIDVREKEEWLEGFIPGAHWIPRGFLELRIEDQVPEKSSAGVPFFAGGGPPAPGPPPPGEAGRNKPPPPPRGAAPPRGGGPPP